MPQSSRARVDIAIKIASLFVWAIVPATAAAESEPKHALSYEARASLGCPSEDQLRAAVAAALGYQPFADDAPTIVSISVRAAHQAVRGRIEMRLADGRRVGQRDLTAPTCEELWPALVLTVAMAIDPMRSVGTPKPPVKTMPPKPPSPPKPAPEVPLSPVTGPPVVRRSRFTFEKPHLFVAADAHVDIQSAPAPAFGLSADIGAAASHWSAAIEFRGDVPSSASVDGSRVTASSVLAAFVPCGRYGFAAVCAIVAGGGQSISGNGFSYWTGYGTAGGRLEVELPVSRRFALLMRLDGVANIVGKEVSGQSWRSPIAVSVGAGISARPMRRPP